MKAQASLIAWNHIRGLEDQEREIAEAKAAAASMRTKRKSRGK